MTIEIAPGTVEWLGGRRTRNAIQDGTAVQATCLVCHEVLQCCPEADYFMCPDCNVVADCSKEKTTNQGSTISFVGLGHNKPSDKK